jgi:hypothetical protein
LEISKVPTEEKIWVREMPLGASHTLTLFKWEVIQEFKTQEYLLVTWPVSQEEMMLYFNFIWWPSQIAQLKVNKSMVSHK